MENTVFGWEGPIQCSKTNCCDSHGKVKYRFHSQTLAFFGWATNGRNPSLKVFNLAFLLGVLRVACRIMPVCM